MFIVYQLSAERQCTRFWSVPPWHKQSISLTCPSTQLRTSFHICITLSF